MDCNTFYKVKDGCGVSGISHGYCKECVQQQIKDADELAHQINQLEG